MGRNLQLHPPPAADIFMLWLRSAGFVAKKCRFCLLFCSVARGKIKKMRSPLPQSRFRSTAPSEMEPLAKPLTLIDFPRPGEDVA